MNIRRTPERYDDHGNAILKNDKLRSALELEIQLAVLHAFDAADLRRHSQESLIATRRHLHSQAKTLRCVGREVALPPNSLGCDIVKPMVLGYPDGSCGVKLLAKLTFLILLGSFVSLAATLSFAQGHEDEIIANLAGGRVIVHVARELIVFAAIDRPVEPNSIPPRVMELDSTHIGVLFGASEWRIPADPKPIRMDRNFQRIGAKDPRYDSAPGEAEPDLETIGVAFLEKLRPLAAQLHHKLDLAPDDPIFQLVIIGYGANQYGPEVWVAEFRIEQEQVATRGEYWQTRILRPRFTQLYPPEKHAPRTLVESRYPADAKGPTLAELIQGNDPRIVSLAAANPHFTKVVENFHGGQAQKSAPEDSADFMRAVLPLIAGNYPFVLGKMSEQGGFDWIVPPTEPVEKAAEDKNRPPEAPTLRRKPKP
jgi:hypothetical protein